MNAQVDENQGFGRNDFAQVLDRIKPVAGISDASVQDVLSKYAGRLDTNYYTHLDEDRASIEIEDTRHCICFIEWEHGYYVTILSKNENTWRTVFVDLVHGSWTVMPQYFQKPEFIGILLSLNGASRDFIASHQRIAR